MKRRARRAGVFASVIVAGACSSPDRNDSGFISLGRDRNNDGGNGAVSETGGASATGGTDVAGGTGGTASASGRGGQGGASPGTGGTGNTCGSGPLPTDEGGVEACERVGRVGRICTPDDRVYYCGEQLSTFIEACAPGTCATGCCHAVSDPCPTPYAYDCAGGCGAFDCAQAPIVNLTLLPNQLEIVRVSGSNLYEEQCGAGGTRRYFEILLDGPAARVTVSPPWGLAESSPCLGAPTPQCSVSPAGFRFVVVTADADAAPPRNVVIETSDNPTCP